MIPRGPRRLLAYPGLVGIVATLMFSLGPLPGHATALQRAPVLGPPPARCPANPPPSPLPHGLGMAIGMQPVYVAGFSRGLRLEVGDTRVIPYGAHGWYRKVAWLVGPNFLQAIRLRGNALATQAPLWFQIGSGPPSTTPVLNPRQPGASLPNQPAGWAFFPSYLFIPRAGCYAVEASWPGGMWRIAFAAGK